jgi:hypothetical protein
MTQPSLLDPVQPDADTYTGRLAVYLMARPGQYIDGLVLATVGGVYAYRTRLSECRTQLGLDIRNRQRRIGKRIISEYAYFPSESGKITGARE